MMEIKKISSKLKCEISGCKNLADYSILTTDNSKYNLNICDHCLREINKLSSKMFTPKSIKNVYQKGGFSGENK